MVEEPIIVQAVKRKKEKRTLEFFFLFIKYDIIYSRRKEGLTHENSWTYWWYCNR